MAKKGGRARRATGSRKRTAAARRPKAAARGQRVVRLKPVHDQVQSALKALKREKQTDDVKKAVGRLNQMLREIKGACGPTMIVPLAAE